MIKITDKQDAILYGTINLIIASLPPRLVRDVLADILAETIHDTAPDVSTALVSADELNFRIRQRLQALAVKAD